LLLFDVCRRCRELRVLFAKRCGFLVTLLFEAIALGFILIAKAGEDVGDAGAEIAERRGAETAADATIGIDWNAGGVVNASIFPVVGERILPCSGENLQSIHHMLKCKEPFHDRPLFLTDDRANLV
jgi:hypothetical protein